MGQESSKQHFSGFSERVLEKISDNYAAWISDAVFMSSLVDFVYIFSTEFSTEAVKDFLWSVWQICTSIFQVFCGNFAGAA